MGWSKEVLSSNVAEVGWDDDTQEIMVTFTNGTVYAYAGADEGVAVDLSRAASVGQMLNSEIKGRYSYRRVR